MSKGAVKVSKAVVVGAKVRFSFSALCDIFRFSFFIFIFCTLMFGL